MPIRHFGIGRFCVLVVVATITISSLASTLYLSRTILESVTVTVITGTAAASSLVEKAVVAVEKAAVVVVVKDSSTPPTRSSAEEAHTPPKNKEPSSSIPGKQQTRRLCFVSSVFAETKREADRPQNVVDIFGNETSSVDFFLFTNLPDLIAPGWTRLVIREDEDTTMPYYNRMITRSRWGKFVGWKDERIAACGAVVYFDAFLRPRNNRLLEYRELARQVQAAEVGIAQVRHDKDKDSFEFIFDKIVENQKDTRSNVNITLSWLRQQPDFSDECKYYLNKYFIYDPYNPTFRKVSTFFWDQYASEVGSWRDQPMWSYSMCHFGVEALPMVPDGEPTDGDDMYLFEQSMSSRGFSGHTYVQKPVGKKGLLVEKEQLPDDVTVLQKTRMPVEETVGKTGRVDEYETAENNNTHMCFVTSVFGPDLETADRPLNVTGVFKGKSIPVDFFLFTNLGSILAPGWKKVIQTDLPSNRFITQSRWGKFLGWREGRLSQCRTVFYVDGYMRPREDRWSEFERVARQVTESDVGLSQVLHDGNLGKDMDEIFEWITNNKKDLPAHAKTTIAWLSRQSDFPNNKTIPYYLNKFFAYDPSNSVYRKVSTFFWDHYSQELGAWRDQPVWSYSLHHFGVVPLVFTDKGDRIGGTHMFDSDKTSMGFGGHTYTEATDNAAAKPRLESTKDTSFDRVEVPS